MHLIQDKRQLDEAYCKIHHYYSCFANYTDTCRHNMDQIKKKTYCGKNSFSQIVVIMRITGDCDAVGRYCLKIFLKSLVINKTVQLIIMLTILPESKSTHFFSLISTWQWGSVLDGCFYVTSDGGSMWWIIDNRLRAANSAFMTDNKCALPNQANWSVPFWNGKRKRKEFIGKIVILCQHFIMDHHHAKSLLWTCSKIKLDIFHTFIILDWHATFPKVTS